MLSVCIPAVLILNFLLPLQSSIRANAKEIGGGIGQKFLEVDVETDNIGAMSYDVYVYGGSSTALPSFGLLMAFIAYATLAEDRIFSDIFI